MQFKPHEYQKFALQWLIQRTIVKKEPGGAYFLDPGLGKTSITLAWLKLLKQLSLGNKTLIVAPMRVMYSVWPQECAKWDQFAHFRCSIVHGTETNRMAALAQDADLYLINPEGVVWLETYLSQKSFPFDTLVVDESSKFKSWGAKRTRALKKLIKRFSRRLILTGTPSPNSLQDLFSQVFILDQGTALGSNITKFRNRYFYRGGFGGYSWQPHAGAQTAIEKRINPMCLRLSAKDHLDLPEMLINDIWVELPEKIKKDYRKLERDMFIALSKTKDRIVGNAGAKYMACKQVANGGVYDEDRNSHHLHEAKIKVVVDLVDELQGKPALVAFQFHHDLERLRQVFHKLPSIDGQTNGVETEKLVEKWNDGELRVLAVQPQALSHGINMQAGPGRDIIWLGLTDSLETYLQLNARIHRQGVTGQVRIHRILATGTVDEAVRDRIESKDHAQSALLAALSKYRGRHESQA